MSVVDQGTTYRSTYVPVDQNSPDFPWVTKNIDFTKWESDEKQQALWLSGACDAGTKEVSSQVIYNAKKKATQSNGCVLYFFCATATESRDSIATVFVHTLLHQIVGFSGDETAQAITTTFLTSLLDGHIRRSLSGFKKDDPLVKTVERILDAPSYDLHIALINALAKAGPQHLSLIIDGISIAAMKGDVFVRNVSLLVNHMIAAGAVGAVGATRFKALLTSSQYSELKGFLGDLPSIQFRQEREGCLSMIPETEQQLISLATQRFFVFCKTTTVHDMEISPDSMAVRLSGYGRMQNTGIGRNRRRQSSYTSRGSLVVEKALL